MALLMDLPNTVSLQLLETFKLTSEFSSVATKQERDGVVQKLEFRCNCIYHVSTYASASVM